MNEVLLALALVMGSTDETSPTEHAAVVIDRNRVSEGLRRYQVITEEQVDGHVIVDSRFADGAYVIHDVSVSESMKLEEDIFIRLDGETFAPRAVDLHADFNGTHVLANVRFADSRATGNVHMHRPSEGRSQDRPVDLELPPGTLTRGAALYLANAMGPIAKDAPLTFYWFNPLSGQLAEITYSLDGQGQITVPAGTFECDVIRQEGGQPGNLIYIDRETGRIVRFDVIGQPVRLELLPADT